MDPPHPKTNQIKEWYTHLKNPHELEHVTNSNEMVRDITLLAQNGGDELNS